MTTDAASDARTRRASVDDARAIAALHVASWHATYPGLIPDEALAGVTVESNEPRRREALAREAEQPDSGHTWVIETDGEVRGFAVAGPARDEAEDSRLVGELYAIYLDPDYIECGLGRQLWQVALADLEVRGFKECIVWVLAGNHRACRFYERAGFRPDGDQTKPAREVPLLHKRYRRPL